MKRPFPNRSLAVALLLSWAAMVGLAASAEAAEEVPGAVSTLPSSSDAGAASAQVQPSASEEASNSFYSAGGFPSLSFGGEEQGPKLDLYGFIDFTYSQNLSRGDSPFDTFPHFGSFAVGNINLYAAGDLGGGFRSLLELRFLYLPHGAITPVVGGPADRVDTNVPDYADLERPLRWGASKSNACSSSTKPRSGWPSKPANS